MENLTRILYFSYFPFVADCLDQYKSGGCAFPGLQTLTLLQKLKGFQNVDFLRVPYVIKMYEMVNNGSAETLAFFLGSPNSNSFHNLSVRFPNTQLTPPRVNDKLMFVIRDTLSTQHVSSQFLFSLAAPSTWALLLALALALFLLKRAGCWTKMMNLCFFLVLTLILGTSANFLAITLEKPPVRRLPFKDKDDLSRKVLSGECKLAFQGRFKGERTMRHLYLYPYEPKTQADLRFNRSFSSNPPENYRSTSELMERVAKSRGCLVTVDWKANLDLIQAQHCGLYAMETNPVHKVSFGLMYRKDWALGQEFERRMDSFEDAYWKNTRDYALKLGMKRKCTDNLMVSAERPIGLGQIGELFLVLARFRPAWSRASAAGAAFKSLEVLMVSL